VEDFKLYGQMFFTTEDYIQEQTFLRANYLGPFSLQVEYDVNISCYGRFHDPLGTHI